MGIGFHVPSPLDTIQHYTYPDENWTVTIKPASNGARYANRHAHAFFGQHEKKGLYDASDYVGHPGDIAIFARLHLAIKHEPLTQRITLNSAEVKALIGAIS